MPYRHAPPPSFSHGQRACDTTSIERLFIHPLPDTGLHYDIHPHYVVHGTPPVRKMAAHGGQAQRPRYRRLSIVLALSPCAAIFLFSRATCLRHCDDWSSAGDVRTSPTPPHPHGRPPFIVRGLAPSPSRRADNRRGAAMGCVTPSRSLVVAAGGFERRPAPRAPWASVFHGLLPHGCGLRPWVVLAPLRSCP